MASTWKLRRNGPISGEVKIFRVQAPTDWAKGTDGYGGVNYGLQPLGPTYILVMMRLTANTGTSSASPYRPITQNLSLRIHYPLSIENQTKSTLDWMVKAWMILRRFFPVPCRCCLVHSCSIIVQPAFRKFKGLELSDSTIECAVKIFLTWIGCCSVLTLLTLGSEILPIASGGRSTCITSLIFPSPQTQKYK